ncbi:hypothetical protein AOLI_G00275230 [Acnodon oligacanthus]
MNGACSARSQQGSESEAPGAFVEEELHAARHVLVFANSVPHNLKYQLYRFVKAYYACDAATAARVKAADINYHNECSYSQKVENSNWLQVGKWMLFRSKVK